MMGALICSKTVRLGAWTPVVVSQAQEAPSLVRRLRRGLANNRLTVEPLSGPLIAQAVVGWVGKRMSVALDTSMVWHTSCLLRLSVLSRGRAGPLGWRVIEHGRAAVSFETYQDLWHAAKSRVPLACKVILLADRGLADTQLLSPLRELGGHFRMRLTSTFGMYPSPLAPLHGGESALQPGHMSGGQEVSITDKHFGPVHLAVARPLGSDAYG
jgi:hypothetical protein